MATEVDPQASSEGDALRAVQGVSVGDPTGGAATIVASIAVAFWGATKAVGRRTVGLITGRARRDHPGGD